MNAIWSRLHREESGMTLVEMLVMFTIFGIITTLAFTMVINSAGHLRTVRQTTDLNEESRLVMNRISRELRESSRIVAVTNPDALDPDGTPRICGVATAPCFNPAGPVSVTFEVDFNGDGAITPGGADPERLTYTYDQPNSRLLLQTADTTLPILAGNVSKFQLSYRSSDYRCDVDSNGEVTWREIEIALSPPCPAVAGDLIGGVSALDAELASIDQIIVELTVLTSPRQQEYRTKIDLRNKL